jgi:hypothetical protein
VCVCVCVGVWVCVCVDVVMTEVFHTLTDVFPCFFLSCKANSRVKLAFLDGARPALFQIFFSNCVVLCIFICVVLCIVVCDCVLPPGDKPIAVNEYNNNPYRYYGTAG